MLQRLNLTSLRANCTFFCKFTTVRKSHSLIHSFIGKIQLSYTVSFVLQVSTPEYNAYGLAAGIGEKIWVPFYVQVPPDSITDMEVRTSLFVVVYIYIHTADSL